MTIKSMMWRAQRRLLGVNVGRLLFFQQGIDTAQNPIKPRTFGRFNQWITEKGCTAPWMMTQEECAKFWSNQKNEDPLSVNRPIDYVLKSQEIIRFLDAFWSGYVSKNDRIMEWGCNSGANLNGLWVRGYRELMGVEINPAALAQLKSSFPEFAEKLSTSNLSIETAATEIPTKSLDVLFTIAVLIHLHPKSHDVFQHMKRITRKYICVIESEWANCSYVFARNYKRVLENVGCKEIKSLLLTKQTMGPEGANYYGYTARLFKAAE